MGKIKLVEGLFIDPRIPSGGMISTDGDLLLWNKNLHGAKLLIQKSYKMMTTASSHREHFIFGKVDYGYGLQIDRKGKNHRNWSWRLLYGFCIFEFLLSSNQNKSHRFRKYCLEC